MADDEGWTTVVNTKKIQKQKALERKREEVITISYSFLQLAEQGIFLSLEDIKNKNKKNEKKQIKKKLTVKQKNAAKANILPANGYTIQFADEKKGKNPKVVKPASKKQESKPIEAAIRIVDGKTLTKVIEKIVDSDPENYSYHLIKLSQEFSVFYFIFFILFYLDLFFN